MTTRAIQIGFLLSGVRHPTTGEDIDGGYVKFYEAGTTTAKYVYTEKEKTNGYYQRDLSTIGTVQLYGDGEYKIEIYDTNDSKLRTLDNIRLEYPTYGVDTVTSSPYTHSTDNDLLLVDTTSEAITINCLAAASWERPLFIFKTGGSNDVTIEPDGSETINVGGASESNYSFSISNILATVVSDGSNLHLIGISSSVLDVDGDTGIELDRTNDNDTVYVKAGGTDIVKIDSSGLDIESGSLLIDGTDWGSASKTFSGKNFSQDGSITITDTGNTALEHPLSILTPNIPNVGSLISFIGKASSEYNSGQIAYTHTSDDNAGNTMSLGVNGHGGIVRIDGNERVGINKTSGGAALDVNGEVESTALDINGNADISGTSNLHDTLTLSKGSGDGLVVTSNADFNGDIDVDGTANLDDVDIDGTLDVSSETEIHDTLTLSKGSGDGLVVTSNADFNGDIDVDGTANLDDVDIDGTLNIGGENLISTPTEINQRCYGYPSEYTAVNSSSVNVGSSSQIVSLNIGTVTSGDRIIVSAYVSGGSINPGPVDFYVGKSSGTATIRTLHSSTVTIGGCIYAIGTNATNHTRGSIHGPFAVTGSGTLVLAIYVASYTGDNFVIPAGYASINAIFESKQ